MAKSKEAPKAEKKTPHSITFFPNGTAAVCDAGGAQIGEYQGMHQEAIMALEKDGIDWRNMAEVTGKPDVIMLKPEDPRPPARAPKAVEVPAPPKPVRLEDVAITVKLAPAVSTKYASGRVDMDLTRSEAQLCRRIQDAIEVSGAKCKGPAAVVRHVLGLLRDNLPAKELP